MKKDDENKRKTAPKYQKVRKVSPLGNLDEEPPTRDDQPHDEFIDKKSIPSKNKRG